MKENKNNLTYRAPLDEANRHRNQTYKIKSLRRLSTFEPIQQIEKMC